MREIVELKREDQAFIFQNPTGILEGGTEGGGEGEGEVGGRRRREEAVGMSIW